MRDYRISRRHALVSLPALATVSTVLAQSGNPPVRVRALNHMTLTVSDRKRSLEFYQGLFGMSVQHRQGSVIGLRIGSGPQYISLSAIAAHNTLSADTTHVRVFYPFHPLHGYSLRITRRPKRGDGAVSVIDPAGRRLKIPVWMICSDAAEIRVSDHAHLSGDALLKLASLIARPTAAGIHDNLLQTSIDGREGGNHAAAAALEPDPNRRGTRAGRRAGTSRPRQSHGPHSGDGVSNGGKENR